eukprot:Anaeramoba_ignava/a482504_22.p1 GENE.a482504_22~~a482504_22.p1  ORF type:complete len:320 (+),score=60.61 a482504_22:1682-2641(+)
MKSLYSIFIIVLLYLTSCTSVIDSTQVKTNRINPGGYYVLPKGLITIKVIKNAKKEYKLVYEQTTLVPDTCLYFNYNYQKSILSDDEIECQVDSKGFLKKISVTTEDKTDDIILKLPELLKESMELYVGATKDKEEENEQDIIVYENTFDPFEKNMLQQINENIKFFDSSLEINLPLNAQVETQNISSCEGIFYRALLPYELEIKTKNSTVKKIIYLPNNSPLMIMEINREVFVKKITNLEFENGVLTKVEIKKPSSLVEIVSLPVNILKAIVGIPAELIQLKINTSSKEKELSEKLKEEIEAKKQLEEYINSLNDPIE